MATDAWAIGMADGTVVGDATDSALGIFRDVLVGMILLCDELVDGWLRASV